MGVETRRLDTRRPPLPAPTESMDEQSNLGTEVATNVTTRTDKSSYSIPDDGSPITISTQKVTSGTLHSRQKSQTSLLIEYFEASKSGDKSRARPSVRVKVTPSSGKKHRGGGSDAIQITGIGKDRKPSYTRRISLGNKNTEPAGEGTELSRSSESSVSQLPPVEIEVLSHSDVSHHHRQPSSRGLMYAPLDSNVSSMPPDSLLESEMGVESELGNDVDRDDDVTPRDDEYLKAPVRSRSRSNSRERITQRIMEKLGAAPAGPRKSSRSSQDRSFEGDYENTPRERRRRPSKPGRYDDSVESSLISSNPTASQLSYRSDRSQASRMTNNPKLLEMVEDTIKRVILPEINAIKEDRRTDRNLRAFEKSRHGSVTPDGYGSGGLERRVSKSSSSPNIVSKPKVVLNREGDDPGTVLSRGDSERIKGRKSSREHKENRPSSRLSSGRSSRGADDIEKHEKTSSRGSHGTRDAAAAALVGGALTAAALRSHDSTDDVYERRKRRNKSRGSRSRSVSNADNNEDAHIRKADIPPMPLASQINESEVTRESILSEGTEHAPFGGSLGTHAPIREVSRGSLGGTKSPASSRTPTRTSLTRGLETHPSNQFTESPRTSNAALSNKSRVAALAAGLGAAAISDERHMDADGYGPTPVQRNIASPVQSVSSLKKRFEDDESAIPSPLRPRSAASRSSAARLHGNRASQRSLRSAESSPSAKPDDSHMHSRNDSTEAEYETPQERRNDDFLREGSGTPSRENMEAWLERQRQVNDRYRDSMGEAANRDSYQTNPYPQDEKRFTHFTEDSMDRHSVDDDDAEGDRDVRDANVGLNPEFVHTPVAVESAVASLMEPSVVSSNLLDSADSGPKNRGSYSERMAEHLRSMGKDDVPAVYEGSTLSQNMPSQDRWAAIKGYAKAISNHSAENINSPRQSPAKSSRDIGSIAEEDPYMGVSGLPQADDPMPEIGHFDDTKSLTTNPSIIQGPLGGDPTGNNTWPYTPEPHKQFENRGTAVVENNRAKDAALLASTGAAALGAAALASATHQPSVEDEHAKGHTPDIRDDGNFKTGAKPIPVSSPANNRDKGSSRDGPTGGGHTPKAAPYHSGAPRDYSPDLEEDDVFASDPRHQRTLSGNSHGMASPLYDSATGNGIDRIQSKDIVALMDHLTVRDAQRNARDTEILVTLVRSAAEMRQSFDEMKRFILEQDKLIMQNTERGAEHTVQRVLGGPRPAPTGSPRTPRRETTSQEDIQTKRKGVLRRALKGLTGGKSSKDLARIEDMLMQVLDNVEDLKQQGGQRSAPPTSYTNGSLDSYEKLRAAPDATFEREVRAGPAMPPTQPGNIPPASRGKEQFHSGYDGRRGSEHRVSTVLEDDEDEDDVLAPHERAVLNHQFENNERMLTPTQEYPRSRGFGSPAGTPPRHTAASNDRTPRTTEKERKHKSTGSSIFGMSAPKVSRWSKTTASSAAPDFGGVESPTNARHFKVPSEASRSGSALGRYEDEEDDDDDDERYDAHDDGRHRSHQSLPRSQQARNPDARSVRSQGSRLTRTPSPLIPSEASHRDAYFDQDHDLVASPIQEDLDDDGYEFDDPKYQAVRNSLLLEHPQPRQGPTVRHQDTLESNAQTFEDPVASTSDVSQRTVSDFDPAVWGSTATAGLARHRLTQFEPLSPVSMNSPGSNGGAGANYAGKSHGGAGARDDGPLVPQAKAAKTQYEPEPEQDWEEPQFSNSGFSKGGSGNGNGNGGNGNYNSTGYYSSPYSSGHLLEPIEEVRYSLETDRSNVSPEPQIAKAVPARKITGPRPMGGSRSSSAASGPTGQQHQHQPYYGTTGQARLVEMSGSGTVRRKPVGHSGASDTSGESETF